MEPCAAGTIPVAGGGCLSLDHADCGDTIWGPRPWPDRTLYVDAGAPDDGADGTSESPYPSVTDALAAAGPGVTVALAGGRHSGSLELPDGVTLAGRCAAEVVLAGSVIKAGDGESTVRDLTIEKRRDDVGIDLLAGTLTVERVAVFDDFAFSVSVDAGRVVARQLHIDAPAALLLLNVTSGGALECERCLVETETGRALAVVGPGSSAALAESALLGLAPDASDDLVATVSAGASLTLTDVLLRSAYGTGLFVTDPGSELSATRFVVEGLAPAVGSPGRAIGVASGGRLTWTDGWIGGALRVGLRASGALEDHGQPGRAEVSRLTVACASDAETGPDGSRGVQAHNGGQLTLTDAAVVGCTRIGLEALAAESNLAATRTRVARGRGVAAKATFGAVLELHDSVVADNLGLAVGAASAETRVVAQRVAIRDTTPGPSMVGFAAAGGVQIQDGASLQLLDVRIAASHEFGLVLLDPGTTADARRLEIVETAPRPGADEYGIGLGVYTGARVALVDATLRDNHSHGAVVDGEGSRLRATGLLVEGTRFATEARRFGRGVAVQAGARLLLTDGRLQGNEELGLVAAGAGTEAELTRLQVDGGGSGVVVVQGASVSWDGGRVEQAGGVGLYLGPSGSDLVASRLTVADTQAGALGGGAGLVVYGPASFVLDDVRVERSRVLGAAFAKAAAGDARRLVVADTRSDADSGYAGRGVVVQSGALVALADARIERNHEAGLSVRGQATRVVAARLSVHETAPTALDGTRGYGVALFEGARAELTDAELNGNAELGLLVVNTSQADLTGAGIYGTVATSAGFGDAIFVEDGAGLRLREFELAGNARTGLVVSQSDRPAELARGTIRDNEVGVVRQLESAVELSEVTIENNGEDGVVCDLLCVDPPVRLAPTSVPAPPG